MKQKTLEAHEPIEQPVSKAEALAAAQRCIAMLKERFGARRVIVFGSAAGQAPWHEDSDLDLAVEGIRPEEFFKASSAVGALMPSGLQVDLVDLGNVYPEMRARILGEVEMPEDPVLALKSLVADELKMLERITSEMKETMDEACDPPTRTEMRAMGSLIQDFYVGVEDIFQRIAVQFDGGVSKTERWHADLLHQLSRAREGVRPAVIDDELWTRLDDYLDFRHFFEHAYGKVLEWDRLRPHVERVPETLAMLRAQLERFFAALRPEDKPS